MSMEIMNNYTNHSTDVAKKYDSAAKKEQANTTYSNVNDYSKNLQDKYSYMNTGTTSVSGIPTTVTVSSAYLKKCMNNPEEAKKLEENLSAIPDGVNYLKNYVRAHGLGSPVVTYVSYTVDDNGNVTMASGSTNDPDGRIAKENAEKAAKEKREEEKKAADKRAAKRIAEEKTEKKRVKEELAEKMAEKSSNDEVLISFTGNSVVSVTQSVASALSENPGVETVAGFDVKA